MKKKFPFQLIPLLCGLLLGLWLLTQASESLRSVNANTLGFAVNSSSVDEERYEGRLFSGFSTSLEELCAGARQWQAEGYRVALWMGNSQLYSIVNYKPGEHLAVHYANAFAAKVGAKVRFVQLAEPNANLYELLTLYLACRQHGFIPDYLILGIVYKNLNDRGLRPTVAAWINTFSPGDLEALGDAAQASAAHSESSQGTEPKTDISPAMDKTLAIWIEGHLDASLAASWPVFKMRDQLRASIEASITRELASMLFAFSKNKRPVVRISPDAQAWNMQAWARLMQATDGNRTKMFVYKVPHQPGLEPFYYVRADYDTFFTALATACATNHVHYADLELLVPSQEWRGYTQFHQPDCFHFQTEGHERLGKAVAETILSLTDQ